MSEEWEEQGKFEHEQLGVYNIKKILGKVKNKQSLTFSDFRNANVDRCNTSFKQCDDWTPSDWGCAISGEVGETCNLIKKMRRGDVVKTDDIGKELADVITYIDLLASRLGLNLEECLRNKFNEVSDRVGSDVKI